MDNYFISCFIDICVDFVGNPDDLSHVMSIAVVPISCGEEMIHSDLPYKPSCCGVPPLYPPVGSPDTGTTTSTTPATPQNLDDDLLKE